MRPLKQFLFASGAALILSGCATQQLSHVADDPRFDALTSDSLTPFSSEGAYKKWRRQSERLGAKRRKALRAQFGDEDDFIIVTGSRQSSGPNITNVQNRGVDEGDIVKQVGDHLVLMQDGRLFSVDIGTGAPTLTARVDIYSEQDEDIWYDELLVSGRRLVVTGYHYGKNATEISVFNLDENGQLLRQGKWYLESEDYYSGDNSATRMIGDTLVFHTSGYVDELADWPALRRKDQAEAQPILQATDIYPPLLRLEDPSLQMVTECKISKKLDCKSRAVMSAGRAEWIVTEEAGYLWVAAPRPDWNIAEKLGQENQSQPSTLYRFPLGSDRVEAIMLNARLNSRFAFEAREDKILALVSKTENDGETELAFLNMPMSEFSETPIQASAADFTPLPGERSYGMRVRFTAENLLYSNSVDDAPVVYVMNLDTRLPPARLAVPHVIRRLDRVGGNAVVIGHASAEDPAGDLGVSWVDLTAAPTLTDTLSLPNRFEAEGRAQALNMRVEESGEALLGLPTYFDGTDPDGDDYDEEDGTDISFARVSRFGQLTDLGPAKGDPSRVDPDYKCETSCVDWYGNARPFFIGDRIFALIASELIELQETPGSLIERSRVNLSAPL